MTEAQLISAINAVFGVLELELSGHPIVVAFLRSMHSLTLRLVPQILQSL